MAKIDRQLAQQFGESTIKVTCAPDEQIDFDLVQLQLVSELRTRSRCLSIDLRSFHGDCSTMAHVILKLQRFASGEGKVIAITNALPAMQAALSPKKRPKQTDQAKTAKDASRSADMALVDHEVSEQMIKSIDQPHENTLPVSPKKLEKKKQAQILGAEFSNGRGCGCRDWYPSVVRVLFRAKVETGDADVRANKNVRVKNFIRCGR